MQKRNVLILIIISMILFIGCDGKGQIKSMINQIVAEETDGEGEIEMLNISESETKIDSVTIKSKVPDAYIIKMRVKYVDEDSIFIFTLNKNFESDEFAFVGLRNHLKNLVNKYKFVLGWEIFNRNNILENDTINCYYFGRDYKLWLGTNKGIYIYDLYFNRGTWSKLNIDYPDFAEKINDIYVDDLDLWFATDKGIHNCNLKNGILKSYYQKDGLLSDKVKFVSEDFKRKIIIVLTENGLNTYNNKKWSVFPIPDNTNSNEIQCLYIDNNSNIWLGYSNKVFLYDFGKRKWIKFDKAAGLDAENIYDIIDSRNGTIWFATDNGAFELNPDIMKCKQYSTANGLSDNHVNILFADDYGNMWFGTDNGLTLHKRKDDSWKIYNKSDKLPSGNIKIFFIQEIDDITYFLWFAFGDTINGLHRYTHHSRIDKKF